MSLAQSVALEFYLHRIDNLLDKFMSMSQEMAVRAGGPHKEYKVSPREKRLLFLMVAAHNALQMGLTGMLMDVCVCVGLVSKLRVFHRSEAAWKHYKYDSTYQVRGLHLIE